MYIVDVNERLSICFIRHFNAQKRVREILNDEAKSVMDAGA
jgi:hypothetical protein